MVEVLVVDLPLPLDVCFVSSLVLCDVLLILKMSLNFLFVVVPLLIDDCFLKVPVDSSFVEFANQVVLYPLVAHPFDDMRGSEG